MNTVALIGLLALWVGPPTDRDPSSALAEATAAFEEERWSEAADAFARAYEQDRQPRYLYGRAQALRFGGDCASAVEAYRAFIDASQSEEANAYAREAITLCEESMAEKAETAQVAAEPTPAPSTDRVAPAPVIDARPPPKARWYRDGLGHGLWWPGVALTAAGAAMVGVAHLEAKDAEQASSERRYRDALDRASALRVVGIVALAVGGGQLVAGAIRFAVVARRGRARERSGSHWRFGSSGLVVRF